MTKETPTLTGALSEEALSTIVGMVEFCLERRYCMGMDEGFKSFDPEVEHDFVKELRAFVDAGRFPAAPHGDSFRTWLAAEMPAGTVIGDPAWWAEHILKRMRVTARGDEAMLLPVATAQDLANLNNFYMAVAQDSLHTIDQAGIRSLTALGALECCGFGKHRLTKFGEYLMVQDAAAHAKGERHHPRNQ